MARKNYTDEFRQRAVDLYESTPGATLKAIAADLGISRGALKARIIRLEAELAVSRAEQVKLETERDILRQAAKYFAAETNW